MPRHVDHVASVVFHRKTKPQEAFDTHVALIQRFGHHHFSQGFALVSCAVKVNVDHAKEDVAACHVLPLVRTARVRYRMEGSGNPFSSEDTSFGFQQAKERVHVRDAAVRPVPRMARGKRRQLNSVAVFLKKCTQLLQHRVRTKAVSGVPGQDEMFDTWEPVLQGGFTILLWLKELSEEMDPCLPIFFGLADTCVLPVILVEKIVVVLLLASRRDNCRTPDTDFLASTVSHATIIQLKYSLILLHAFLAFFAVLTHFSEPLLVLLQIRKLVL